MSSLSLYRDLVPDHASVTDAVVTRWLELAAQRHTASAWGDLYGESMVWWAAHRIEKQPGAGVAGSGAASTGPLLSQKDGDLSRSYGSIAGTSGLSATDAELASTTYGQLYLSARAQLAASSPTRIGVGVL